MAAKGTIIFTLQLPIFRAGGIVDISAWVIGGRDTSQWNDVTNIEHLYLVTGSGNDSVTFNEPLFDITNTSPFGANDYWDAGGGTNSVTVNLAADTGSVNAGYYNSDSSYYVISDPDGQLLGLNNVQNFNITGGSGNDTLVGGAGTNVLNGGAGNNTLVAGSGTNTIIGGTGNDYIEDISGGVSAIDGGKGDNYLDLQLPNLSRRYR